MDNDFDEFIKIAYIVICAGAIMDVIKKVAVK